MVIMKTDTWTINHEAINNVIINDMASIHNESKNSNRLEVLDLLRGLTLISMICYHAAWDLVYMFGVEWPFYKSLGGYVWQQSICWSFILLSGFCVPLGKRPVRRGLIVFFCGAAVTAVTLIFMPSNRVVFGILTFMGSAMILAGGLHNTIHNSLTMTVHADDSLHNSGDPSPHTANTTLAAPILTFLTFLLLKPINSHRLAFNIPLPEALYRNNLTACFGFPPKSFFSTDYFSLLPWIFLFFTGYFLYFLILPKYRKALEKAPCKPLQFIGRHTLFIYMLHQPVIYLIFSLIFSPNFSIHP